MSSSSTISPAVVKWVTCRRRKSSGQEVSSNLTRSVSFYFSCKEDLYALKNR